MEYRDCPNCAVTRTWRECRIELRWNGSCYDEDWFCKSCDEMMTTSDNDESWADIHAIAKSIAEQQLDIDRDTFALGEAIERWNEYWHQDITVKDL